MGINREQIREWLDGRKRNIEGLLEFREGDELMDMLADVCHEMITDLDSNSEQSGIGE